MDITACIPVALREHLREGATDPEHRNATIAFVHFDGVDGMLAESGADVVAAGLHELVEVVQRHAEHNGVTFLGTDIDHDGGKIILVGGAPNALGDDEGRMLLTLRAIIDADASVPVRIGVNRGHVFAGDVGPAYRRTYTVIGDAANLAARVMSMAVPGQILLDGTGARRVVDRVQRRRARAVHGQGEEGPRPRAMAGYLTGSKPEDVARPPARRAGRRDGGVPSGAARPRHGLARRDRRQRRDGEDAAAHRVPLGGAGPAAARLGLRALRVVGAVPPDAAAPAPARPGRRGRAGRDRGPAPGGRGPARARSAPVAALLAIVADVDVPPTPEVEDLDGEFRRPKLEEVLIDYLGVVRSRRWS